MHLRVGLCVALVALFPGAVFFGAGAGAAGETWNPQVAGSAGVPTPSSGGPFYQYAPSIVQLSETDRIIYYCANRVGGQVWDHIGVNRGTRRADGSYAWGSTFFALNPQSAGTPRWASRHICDPEVVRGTFRYAGHSYTWAMFFTGYPDTDRFPGEDPVNVVGVAYADAPEGPWTIAQRALLDRGTEGPLSSWGIGQPSATSIDGGGRVLLFYSGLGDVVRREVDLSNADSPQLGARMPVPTAGLTPEPGGGPWLHNASFVYDPARNEFLVSRDTGPWNDRVQQHTEIDRIAGGSIWSGSGTWSVLGQVNSCLSGYPYNHNSGIVRNAFGMVASPIDVYFAIEPPGGGFWSYRLWQARSPLSFVSGSRPALIDEQDGRLSVFGHTANRCEANVWSSTQVTASTEYGSWTRFGASPAGPPVATRQPDGRVVLFARAADGSIWWNRQSVPSGGFSGWAQLAGLSAVEDPVVSLMQDGRLVVAIRRNDAPGSRVYLNVQQAPNGDFGSGWQDLGASPVGPPVLGTNQDGSLVLFARAAKGAGGQIWFNPQLSANSAGWGGWRVVEGSAAYDGGPTVARQADGRLVVAARRWEGSLSVVYVNTQTAANSAAFAPTWTSLGASPAYDPVLVNQAGGYLAILARAVDGTIWWRHQADPNGPFVGWSNLGGSAGGDPVARVRADQRLDVVIRQTDGRVVHSLQTAPGSVTFGSWEVIP